MKRVCAFLLVFAVPNLGLHADVPVRTEQLVYSVIAYNGRDYSPTFVPERSSTIYLLSGAKSFVSLRKTLVYYWPLAGKLQTDTETLNEQLAGTLQIRDARGAVLREISLQRYTFFNVRSDYEENWKVAVGDEADRVYRHSLELSRNFLRSVDDYNRLNAEYLARLRRMSDRIEALKAAGKDASALTSKMNLVAPPRQPVEPKEYVVPPAPIQQAFVLDLPPGEFRVRMVNPDGSIMEGSDKVIVSYVRRRSNAVGYEVIPSDKWTRPELSKTPSSVLSVNGTADLYLIVFFQDEFNDLDYEKTVDNAAKGNPSLYTWVRVQHVPHATLEVRTSDGRFVMIAEQPWSVNQAERTSLGYTITPYIEAAADRAPDLVAFKLPIASDSRGIDAGLVGKTFSFRAMDSKGALLPGSERQIRIVQPVSSGFLLGLISMLPLLLMAVVLFLRARYHSGQ